MTRGDESKTARENSHIAIVPTRELRTLPAGTLTDGLLNYTTANCAAAFYFLSQQSAMQLYKSEVCVSMVAARVLSSTQQQQQHRTPILR
jgi:ferredoxin-like protein FixX